MHDLLFENQRFLGERLLNDLAQQLRLSFEELTEALEEGRFSERVQRDFSGGVRSGVNGTPTFFINGARHDQDFDFETFVQAIESKSA